MGENVVFMPLTLLDITFSCIIFLYSSLQCHSCFLKYVFHSSGSLFLLLWSLLLQQACIDMQFIDQRINPCIHTHNAYTHIQWWVYMFCFKDSVVSLYLINALCQDECFQHNYVVFAHMLSKKLLLLSDFETQLSEFSFEGCKHNEEFSRTLCLDTDTVLLSLGGGHPGTSIFSCRP